MNLTSSPFKRKLKNKRKNQFRKNFFYSKKEELSRPNIKIFLIFSQNIAVLIFQEMKTQERSLLQKMEILASSLKNLQGRNLQGPKSKHKSLL